MLRLRALVHRGVRSDIDNVYHPVNAKRGYVGATAALVR